MPQRYLLIIIVTILLALTLGSRSKKRKPRPVYDNFPILFRDHVFGNLSELGEEVYYAIGVHPLCVEKKGQCIPRKLCQGRSLLYMSRLCYRHDLVCCFDSSIRYPEINPEPEDYDTL